MPSKKLETRIQISKSVLSKVDRQGNVTILDLDNDKFGFQLDRVAAQFWKLIDGKRSFEKIVSILHRKNSKIDRTTVEGNSAKLLKELKRNGLIVEVSKKGALPKKRK